MPDGVSWYLNLPSTTSWSKFNVRMVLTTTALQLSGSYVRIKIHAGTSILNITGASIGIRSGTTDDFTATPTRLTFGGSNGISIPANGAVWSDWIAFSLDKASVHLVHICALVDSSNAIAYGSIGTNNSYYQQSALTDDTMVQNVSYTLTSNSITLGTVQVCDDPSVVAWLSYLSTDTITNTGHNYRMILSTFDIVPGISGNQVRGLFQCAVGHGNQTLAGASIGERSGSTIGMAAVPVRFTFSGAYSILLTDGEATWSDWINFSIDPTKDQLLHIYSSFNYARTGSTQSRYASNASTYGDQSIVQTPEDAYTLAAGCLCLQAVQFRTASLPTGPTMAQLMRHGIWFSDGIKQSMFWAD